MMSLTPIRLALALALLISLSAVPAFAQDKTTLGGFKSSQNIKQKSAKPQLAKRLGDQQDAKSSILNSKTDQKNAADKKPPDKKPPQPVSNARRAELMKFVDAHHKELRPLLNQLRKQRPGQYQVVLRTLDRNVDHLQSLEKRAPARYPYSLDQWILSSRIQLLSAQLAVKKTENEKANLRKQIRLLVREQFDLRIGQLEIDTEQAKKRYEYFQAQLDELKPSRTDLINRRMEEIDKTSERISAQNKKAKEKKKADALRKKSEQSKKVKK